MTKESEQIKLIWKNIPINLRYFLKIVKNLSPFLTNKLKFVMKVICDFRHLFDTLLTHKYLLLINKYLSSIFTSTVKKRSHASCTVYHPVYQYCILIMENFHPHNVSIGVFTCILYCNSNSNTSPEWIAPVSIFSSTGIQ